MIRERMCPGCRKVEVAGGLLACRDCWSVLAPSLRRELEATAALLPLVARRRRALESAFAIWRGLRTSPELR